MKAVGVFVVLHLLGIAIGGMVIFELFRFNILPALMWLLIAAAYLVGLMVLVDRIEDRGGFDG